MTLGERMKKYEVVSKTSLMQKTPVIIRVDGKAFHTYTRRFNKPLDTHLADAMQAAMLYLCETIQGCVFGYTQSDEISLVLTDYKSYESCGWFDYEIQKLCSVCASMTTMKFNQFIQKTEGHANDGTALFDARAFNLLVDEVCNYLIWRQQDCERNALGSFARAFYSHKQLEGKKHPDLVAMLQEKDISWENMSHDYKRGVIAYKVYSEGQEHPEWTLDKNTPVFSTNKEFIQEILTKL